MEGRRLSGIGACKNVNNILLCRSPQMHVEVACTENILTAYPYTPSLNSLYIMATIPSSPEERRFPILGVAEIGRSGKQQCRSRFSLAEQATSHFPNSLLSPSSTSSSY